MNTHAAASVRELWAADEALVLDAFNATFARVDPRFRARTSAHWRWLYVANPAGRSAMIAVSDDGALRAHYAGLPVVARIDGERRRICQAVDTFVTEGATSGLARGRLFRATSTAFRDRFLGAGDDRACFVYGLPNAAAWRVGSRHLGYRLLRECTWLCATTETLTRLDGGDGDADETRVVDREFELLHERCTREVGAVVVRDTRYLAWRYLDAPHAVYRIAHVRSDGALRAWLVLREVEIEGERCVVIVDWCCSNDDEDAARALWRFAAACARATDAAGVRASFAPHSAEWMRFQRVGFRVRRASCVWAGFTLSRTHDVEWYARHFAFSASDTDLV